MNHELRCALCGEDAGAVLETITARTRRLSWLGTDGKTDRLVGEITDSKGIASAHLCAHCMGLLPINGSSSGGGES